MKLMKWLIWGGFSLILIIMFNCSVPEDITDTTTVSLKPSILVNGGTIKDNSNDITLSSFYMDQFEVTYSLWHEIKRWALAHGYSFKYPGSKGYSATGLDLSNSDYQPISCISWDDAIVWCNAYSEKYHLKPCYYTNTKKTEIYRNAVNLIDLSNDCVDWTANGYRLPTEAEWEFAARDRGSWTEQQYSGGDNIDELAWYANNSNGNTQPSDHIDNNHKPNNLGIYDLCGNVYEMCWDRSSPDLYNGFTSTNPHGTDDPAITIRVAKGGSCLVQADNCIIQARQLFQYEMNFTILPFGFRTVRNAN